MKARSRRVPRRPHFKHEEKVYAAGAQCVAGVDEAGRGPLAGPVVAAAVILPRGFRHRRLHDSKRLTAEQREDIYAELIANRLICWAFGLAAPRVIDRVNILRATHAAMRRAVRRLTLAPDHVLIDGLPVRPFPVAHTAIVDGDARCLSIAAASVIAKVTRDRLMTQLDAQYPAYGFARHKGYGTSDHLAILARDGPCPIHRYSFRPVAQPLLLGGGALDGVVEAD